MPSPKCDHKVIAWLDYSIPVSLKARWMVQDITGILAFATKPKYKQCSALVKHYGSLITKPTGSTISRRGPISTCRSRVHIANNSTG